MAKFKIDQAHSSIGFEVKHMMISKVRGNFDTYTADVVADDLADLTTAAISFTIDAASISTRNEERDKHLRSADFFDVENIPSIEFVSTNITKSGDDYEVTGDLTIKGITKQTTFEVEFGGKATDPWGNEVYGFEVESKIKREDFGLTWNAALEAGGVLVGSTVKIKAEFQLNPVA